MRVGTKQFERVSELMVRHEYQTVAGAAAVMSWLPSPERSLGKPGTRDSLDQLRALVLMKHGGDPYVVIQDYRAERAAHSVHRRLLFTRAQHDLGEGQAHFQSS